MSRFLKAYIQLTVEVLGIYLEPLSRLSNARCKMPKTGIDVSLLPYSVLFISCLCDGASLQFPFMYSQSRGPVHLDPNM